MTETVKTWNVTLPDGRTRSGTGDIPADIAAMLRGQGSRLQRQWEITLPDGTVKRGVGEIPADLARLLGQ